jgi:hypothetical protein
MTNGRASQTQSARNPGISEKPKNVNRKNLKLKPSEHAPQINWAAVDAAALADTPDDDSPELTSAQRKKLRPLVTLGR